MPQKGAEMMTVPGYHLRQERPKGQKKSLAKARQERSKAGKESSESLAATSSTMQGKKHHDRHTMTDQQGRTQSPEHRDKKAQTYHIFTVLSNLHFFPIFNIFGKSVIKIFPKIAIHCNGNM